MSPTPLFSVVVPTYRRTRQLHSLLCSLARLRYEPDRFEVIVVDDGGAVPLGPVVAPFDTRLNLTLLEQRNWGPGAARNTGAMRARGRFLAFTDDDCVVDGGWLSALEDALRKAPVSICGGRTVNYLSQNPYSTASQMLLDFLYLHYSPRDHVGGFFPTYNLALPKAKFLEMGGFHAGLRFGEDRDFCHRWATSRYPFCSVPEAVVYHAHALGPASFLLAHFRYGGGSYQYRRRCVERNIIPPKLSPPSFYLQLVLSGVKQRKNLHGMLLSLLLLASQGANINGFFFEALRHRLLSRK